MALIEKNKLRMKELNLMFMHAISKPAPKPKVQKQTPTGKNVDRCLWA